MTIWLFDAGNTRLKYAPLLADGRLGAVQALAYDDGQAWLAALPEGQQACLASVASTARREALLAALSARFTQVHQAQTVATLGPLRIAYAQPAHLGVDRFLAMLAATGTDAGADASANASANASLVVGVGTALTLDVLDASGRHRGGRIAPSPQLMREALHARAAQLPVQGGHYAEFADDTTHALVSGCEGAALALIERSLHKATELLGAPPRLWVHGGGAPALRPQLPAHLWQPDAVLLGLARWYPLRNTQIT